MASKFTNNASTRLAAGVSISDTSITVLPGDGVKFPSLSATDWFPATLVNSAGEIEIVKVTARSGDVFTAQRGQEGTAAKTFYAGDRIELRMTAGSLQSVLSEKVDKTGNGSISGDLSVSGALSSTSVSATSATFTTVNGGSPWTTANLTPSTKADLSGATFTGAVSVPGLTISSAASSITMIDTDWGTRYVYHNGGLMGFLTSSGGWAWYVDNAGNSVATGNVSAYSDARLKENIVQVSGALAIVRSIRGVRYRRTDTGENQVGVIAQEVRAVMPELVHEDGFGMLSVAYGNMAGLFVEAIKDIAERVDALESRPWP